MLSGLQLEVFDMSMFLNFVLRMGVHEVGRCRCAVQRSGSGGCDSLPDEMVLAAPTVELEA